MKKAIKQAEETAKNETFTTESKSHFAIISYQITLNKKLSDNAKSLYIYLKSHSEYFYLSQRTIAKYLNKSVMTIARAINELKTCGFLEIERKPNTNEYKYILLDTPTNEDYKINEKLNRVNELTKEEQMQLYKAIETSKNITKKTKERLINYLIDISKAHF